MLMKTSLLIDLLIAAAVCSCTGHGSLPESFDSAEKALASNPDSALAILGNAKVNADEPYAYATWCLIKTWAEYNAYRQDISEEQSRTGIEYFLKRGDKDRKALAYYLRAVLGDENKTRSKSQVVDDLQHGCKAMEGSEDHYLASLLYMRYGCEMNERKWYDSAEEALQKAMKAAEAGDLKILQVTILINLSHTYMFTSDESRDYAKALECTRKAVRIAEENHLEGSYAKALYALSSCCSRAGLFQEALNSALKANKIAEEQFASGKRKDPVRHIAIADAYRKIGDADSALFYAAKDTSSASAITRASATQLFYIVYRDLLKDNANAVRYLSQYNDLKNKIAESQENDKVLRNEVEMEQDIAKEKRNKLLKTALAAIASILAVTAGILIVHRRRIRQKDMTISRQSESLKDTVSKLKATAGKLERKEAELRKNAEMVQRQREEIHHIVVDKSDLVKQLREMPRYLKDEEADAIVNLVDNAYDGFCTSLESANPELTRTNIRLAALMKLGFTTGQIAVMQGISPASVTKAKQRLKSKISNQP